jgi:hypothetical protein
MSSKFSVFGQFIGLGETGSDSEPEMIVKGLTFSKAYDSAESKFFEYCRQFSCQFSVTMSSDSWEATREIDGYKWGYRVYIESETAGVTARELSEAFGVLRNVLELEGVNPDSERFLLSDIESDLARVLSGKLRIENGAICFD